MTWIGMIAALILGSISVNAAPGDLLYISPCTRGAAGSPAIDQNDNYYIGCNTLAAPNSSSTYNKASLKKIDPDSTPEVQWTFHLSKSYNKVHSSPALSNDELTVYFGDVGHVTTLRANGGTLYAVDSSDGDLKWSYPQSGTIGDIYSSPAIGMDGSIYFGSDDGHLYALNSDGSLRWKSEQLAAEVRSSPSISSWNIFVVAGNILYVIDPNGATKCSYTHATDTINTSPAIDSNGNVYFGADDQKVYKTNSSCEDLWSTKPVLGGKVVGSPVIAPNGKVYVASSNGIVTEIDPFDGSKDWDVTLPTVPAQMWTTSILGGIAIGSSGLLYVGNATAQDGNPKSSVYNGLYVLDPSKSGAGKIADVFDMTTNYTVVPTEGSPNIDSNGHVTLSAYLSGDEGGNDFPYRVFTYDSYDTGLANSDWPNFGGNRANQRNAGGTVTVDVDSSEGTGYDGWVPIGVGDISVIIPYQNDAWTANIGYQSADSQSNAFYWWKFKVPVDGQYKISADIVAPGSSSVIYSIPSDGGGFEAVKNQSYTELLELTSAGNEAHLKAGASYTVAIKGNGVPGSLIAGDIKIEWVGVYTP